MNSLSSLTILLVLMFVTSISVTAQEKIVISTNPPPIYLPLPVLKKIGQAKITYNERKNEVVPQTISLQVIGKFLDGIRLQARFATEGKKVIKPEKILLVFSPVAKDRTYVDDRTIKIILDKKEVLNGMSRFANATSDGRVIIASLEQEIPYDLFVRLSKAKKIKMQIGQTEFDLKESDIDSFHDLLKLIEK